MELYCVIKNPNSINENNNKILKPDDIPPLSLEILPVDNQLHALFLVGTKENIKEAEAIIAEIESSAQDPKEKVIFYLAC